MVIDVGQLGLMLHKSIANVTASYKKVDISAIISFAKSDVIGTFKLALKVIEGDGLQLNFNHLSYAKLNVHVVNASARYVYILKSELRRIQEVKIAHMSIIDEKT